MPKQIELLKMPYNSQKVQMWAKLSMLSREGSTRRSITSRVAYDKVCQAFYQAENYPLPYKPSTNVKEFLAESNVWLYYVGESMPFPGHDPRLPTPSAPIPLSAFAMRHELRVKRGIFSQLGWNPETGEPWMAIRCYADRAYPALSGLNQKYIFELKRMEPSFILQYTRFVGTDFPGSEKYILMWPEFRYLLDLVDSETWEKFNQFRAFLQLWASEPGDVRTPISECYWKHLRSRSYAKQTLAPLPANFDFEYYRSFMRTSSSLQERHSKFSANCGSDCGSSSSHVNYQQREGSYLRH